MANARMAQMFAVFLAGIILCPVAAHGYPVGPALDLKKMAEESDLVFKGTAGAETAVEDGAFKPLPGFAVRETRFKVVSVIKGEPPAGDVAFRHYDFDRKKDVGYMYMPQLYRFETGKTYILFAKKGDAPGVFRQAWMSHTSKPDQGCILCGDDKPVTVKTIREAVWLELTSMLQSPDPAGVTYAVDQLDRMSGRGWSSVAEFDREKVMKAMSGLLSSKDPKVARTAVLLVGSHNPYMSEERTIFWLSAVGVPFPGIGAMDPKMSNPGGRIYWKELVALVDAPGEVETRELAVLALGLVREPKLREPLARWIADPAAPIRASAAVLLADFPGPETRKDLTRLADDAAPEVRAAVAKSAGFAHDADLVGLLAKLLADKDVKVRRAAAMSLLSFSPKDEAVAKVFKANVAQEEFGTLFLLALAAEKPADYLDDLAKTVERGNSVMVPWGGQMPGFRAWEMLFKHLQALPYDDLRAGKYDRYLDAMEKLGPVSSSEPRDLYALYVQRSMTDRAKKFREAAKKSATYDIDYYFKMVDEDPWLYERH